MFNKDEKPLDNIVEDGGFCGIFRTIACVGDSLSSGEFQVFKDGENKYYDKFEYSWGQYIARMTGAKVYNFSRGGMTAKEYIESFAEQNDFWNVEKKAQAYIIALGVNDLLGRCQEVGKVEDALTGKDTFASYYGRLVARLREINPKAFFFFVTMPNEGGENVNKHVAQQQLMYDFAKVTPNSFVIDLFQYAPKYDEEFKKAYYLYGHMNACGYMLTAKMIASYIDYIVRKDPTVFNYVGLMDEQID